jgi:hypothetical protein
MDCLCVDIVSTSNRLGCFSLFVTCILLYNSVIQLNGFEFIQSFNRAWRVSLLCNNIVVLGY